MAVIDRQEVRKEYDEGVRLLAAGVLGLAVREMVLLATPGLSKRERARGEEAAAFLVSRKRQGDRRFWCEVLGINSAIVRKAVMRKAKEIGLDIRRGKR